MALSLRASAFSSRFAKLASVSRYINCASGRAAVVIQLQYFDFLTIKALPQFKHRARLYNF